MINDVTKARLWHHRTNRFFWGTDGFIYLDLTNVGKCHIVCIYETVRKDLLPHSETHQGLGKGKIFGNAYSSQLEENVCRNWWSYWWWNGGDVDPWAHWNMTARRRQDCGWKRNIFKFSCQWFPMGSFRCLFPFVRTSYRMTWKIIIFLIPVKVHILSALLCR